MMLVVSFLVHDILIFTLTANSEFYSLFNCPILVDKQTVFAAIENAAVASGKRAARFAFCTVTHCGTLCRHGPAWIGETMTE
jgi:hypothetical protein